MPSRKIVTLVLLLTTFLTVGSGTASAGIFRNRSQNNRPSAPCAPSAPCVEPCCPSQCYPNYGGCDPTLPPPSPSVVIQQLQQQVGDLQRRVQVLEQASQPAASPSPTPPGPKS